MDEPTATPTGPLSHIKVLDLTHARAGPTCIRVLSDLGADVVQVTRPSTNASFDPSFPNFDLENLHRNKRSIMVNLQTDEGRAVLYKLVESADVVAENFRPDVKHRLKIDYESLRAVNPRIVVGSLSGFGQDGPYAPRPGVDQIAQGMSGIMSVTGEPGSGPWRVGVAIADLCSGHFLAQGIMAALLERERSGVGQWVQTSLLEAAISMLDFQGSRWTIAGEVAPQAGNDHPTGFPTGVFPTRDGSVNIAARDDAGFVKFCRVLGTDELAVDERFRTAPQRAINRVELRDLIEAKLRLEDSETWIQRLNDIGVPCGPILSIDQVFADPQVQHLRMAQPVDSPTYGVMDVLRSPIRLSRTSTSLRTAAPTPGGDTEQVLQEAGYSMAEIDELRLGGAIAVAGKVQA